MNAIARFAFGRPLPQRTYSVPQVAARPATALVGRVCLATIFLVSGIGNLLDLPGTIAYAEAAGLPWARGMVLLAAVLEVVGGLSILLGLLARIGALGLAVFLLLAAFFIHDFWNFVGPERQMQQIHFLKNLAIFGGMLLIIAEGAGRYSIDRMLRRRVTPGVSAE